MSAIHPPAFRLSVFRATFAACALAVCATSAAEPTGDELSRSFVDTIEPFLKSHCLACHGTERQEAKLDLSVYLSRADVSKAHPTWVVVLERLEALEMPPE